MNAYDPDGNISKATTTVDATHFGVLSGHRSRDER
jgi:hypothetical protein